LVNLGSYLVSKPEIDPAAVETVKTDIAVNCGGDVMALRFDAPAANSLTVNYSQNPMAV
jgi:hypothetical protein